MFVEENIFELFSYLVLFWLVGGFLVFIYLRYRESGGKSPGIPENMSSIYLLAVVSFFLVLFPLALKAYLGYIPAFVGGGAYLFGVISLGYSIYYYDRFRRS
ncbi:MAG: hypothetical protein R6U61_01135 [Thermoplasmata archaeon]